MSNIDTATKRFRSILAKMNNLGRICPKCAMPLEQLDDETKAELTWSPTNRVWGLLFCSTCTIYFWVDQNQEEKKK